MRAVFGLVLLLGVGLAGFAVYLAQGYISDNQAALAAERSLRSQIVPTVEVYVADRQLRYGQRLGKGDVRTVRWPRDAVPKGAYLANAKPGKQLFPDGEAATRAVLRAMEKDEAVLAIKVTEPGEDAGVASRLVKGMRAFAVRVDVASGVSGFLRPGDRVDVYWTGRNNSEGGEFTKLIEAGIKIIGVDQISDEDRSAPLVARTVTIEATPIQVAALAQAQATGRLALSLVGVLDDTEVAGVEINQRDLLGIEDRVVVERKAERKCSIRTRKGAEVVIVPIACTD